MTATTLGRKVWIGLTVLGAAAVVILSWRVPEPDSTNTRTIPTIDNVSHMQWVPQEVLGPAPSYGGR